MQIFSGWIPNPDSWEHYRVESSIGRSLCEIELFRNYLSGPSGVFPHSALVMTHIWVYWIIKCYRANRHVPLRINCNTCGNSVDFFRHHQVKFFNLSNTLVYYHSQQNTYCQDLVKLWVSRSTFTWFHLLMHSLCALPLCLSSLFCFCCPLFSFAPLWLISPLGNACLHVLSSALTTSHKQGMRVFFGFVCFFVSSCAVAHPHEFFIDV